MTDARSALVPSHVEPSFLPVSLQLPKNRVADSAVTPTNVELPTSEPAVPRNPDSSEAEATPLSTTEPQLGVKPMDAPMAGSASEPTAAATSSKGDAAEPEAEVSAVDPRERPRMPATVVDASGDSKDAEPESKAAEAPPAAEPEPEPAATAAPAGPAQRTPKATLTTGDPANSLGLPAVTLPASYVSHQTVAVRGSTQVPQPPPVLASPQVEPSPQSFVGPPAKKTWRRPCLRRLVRRMWHLGEFADPPTAKPH